MNDKYSLDSLLLAAIKFASDKHVSQRRKGCENIPYINHVIKVAYILQETGKETNPQVLAAAVLHDVIEDTNTTEEELSGLFGNLVASLVKEVTDDMTLTYDDRKRFQIKKAPFLTNDVKKIKIADKIANIHDILNCPLSWSNRRKRMYVDWSEKVIEGCRGVNQLLDKSFDEIVLKAKDILIEED